MKARLASSILLILSVLAGGAYWLHQNTLVPVPLLDGRSLFAKANPEYGEDAALLEALLPVGPGLEAFLATQSDLSLLEKAPSGEWAGQLVSELEISRHGRRWRITLKRDWPLQDGSNLDATRVAKSTNGGTTWSNASSGLPDIPVTKLAVDPGDGTGNTVYAATWLGVYRTTNGGSSWSVFGTGLPQGRATDIWVAPDSSAIRVSTWGRGVWELQNAPLAGTVGITPASAFLYSGDVVTFAGTVNGGGTVTYTATGGTITSGGVYTAGNTTGDFTVTATNAGNPS